MTRFYTHLLTLLLPAFLGSMSTASAQDYKFGIRAGMSLSTFLGESEKDDQGNSLESNRTYTGFHLGATARYKISPSFGLATELMYSQKGTKYKYSGKGYYNLVDKNNNLFNSTGDLQVVLNVSNSYLEVPLMVYYRPHRNIELSAGVYGGVMFFSTANGELYYKDGVITNTGGLNGVEVDSILISLNYTTFKDKAGDGSLLSPTTPRNFGTEDFSVPTALGAYYGFPEKQKSLYNIWDFGVNLGGSYVFNNGLSFGVRANYGLLDVTNNFYEYSRYKTQGESNNFARVSRADFDRNFNIQLSVGFHF